MTPLAMLWLFEASAVQACVVGAAAAHVARHRAEVAVGWVEGCERLAAWWAALCRAWLAVEVVVLSAVLPPHGAHRREVTG